MLGGVLPVGGIVVELLSGRRWRDVETDKGWVELVCKFDECLATVPYAYVGDRILLILR